MTDETAGDGKEEGMATVGRIGGENECVVLEGDVNEILRFDGEREDMYCKFSDGTILRVVPEERPFAGGGDDDVQTGRYGFRLVRPGRLFELIDDDGVDAALVHFRDGLSWARETRSMDRMPFPPGELSVARRELFGFEWAVRRSIGGAPIAGFNHEEDAMLFASSRALLEAADNIIAAWANNPSCDFVAALEDLKAAAERAREC